MSAVNQPIDDGQNNAAEQHAQPLEGELTQTQERAQHYSEELRKSGHPFLADLVLCAHNTDQAAELIRNEHPHIALLKEAPSYNYGEEPRTVKSIIVAARLLIDDQESLGGENQPKVAKGLTTLRDIFLTGLKDIGSIGQPEEQIDPTLLGFARVVNTLTAHDLAKTPRIAKAANDQLGYSDHDEAKAALANNNYEVLRGVISDEDLGSLQELIKDPGVKAALTREHSMGGFNAGRFAQGEGDLALFEESVPSVDAAMFAEWICDWASGNGNTDLGGPIFLSHIPIVINGTAEGINRLLTIGAVTDDIEEVFEEFAYPAEVLEGLGGLSRDGATNKAVTRFIFMGREQQREDTKIAIKRIAAAVSAFDSIPEEVRVRLVENLGTKKDLDLGITPHSFEGFNLKRVTRGEEVDQELLINHQYTKDTYTVFLHVLDQVISEIRDLGLTTPNISCNWSREAGESLWENLDVTPGEAINPEELVSSLKVEAIADKNGGVTVKFGRK